ncbi:hypothetical protein [Microbacterium sp. CIAB417]|uniref:hypothetical protein n=1 Tax=Microbacterium sp. CIAB417 TaxID=2860287 RepID=UPI001FAD97BD|nr:hypothetical protein [Microbacterium sp. CIAB417]
MRRAMAVGMLGLGMLAAATGCAPQACPAIGWISVVEVDATAVGDAVFVQLCVNATCSPAPDSSEADAPAITVTTDEHTWSFGFIDLSTPENVTVRVYRAGALTDETEHAVDWTHSTEACGGPSIADPIVLGG